MTSQTDRKRIAYAIANGSQTIARVQRPETETRDRVFKSLGSPLACIVTLVTREAQDGCMR